MSLQHVSFVVIEFAFIHTGLDGTPINFTLLKCFYIS